MTDDDIYLSVRWTELRRFIVARARPFLARLGTSIVANNGLDDEAWEKFHLGLVNDLASRVTAAQLNFSEGAKSQTQTRAEASLSLVGNVDLLRRPLNEAAIAMLAKRQRGDAEADLFGMLIGGLRRGLNAARRELTNVTEHEDRTWQTLDRLSRDYLRGPGAHWSSRCDWAFFSDFSRHLKGLIDRDRNLVTDVTTLARYFGRFCIDCQDLAYEIDSDGDLVEPTLPVSGLPRSDAARRWLTLCLEGLPDDAREMIAVQFNTGQIAELNAKSWRERNQISRHRFERSVDASLSALRACLEEKIKSGFPDELHPRSVWSAIDTIDERD
ncbi:hypothetical protein [Sandarakinorhabdus sp.]|uniref:hypothetical protein n=1 Tax=Sandarakinorhabdus sp. TaxID=1916663 RepID=UPI003F70D6C2